MASIQEIYAYKADQTPAGQKSTYGNSSNDLGGSFMSLLLAQMRNQNPMQPMDDTQMISQLAQLNSLQELQKLNTALKELSTSNQFLTASSLIGKTVTYTNAGKLTVSGKVTSISQNSSKINLSVGTDVIDLTSILSVSQGG